MSSNGRPGRAQAGARAPRPVTSLQNERVKLIRSLDMRKARRETGLFVAEGTALLVTAREHNFVPVMLVMLAGAAQDGIARGLVEWALESGSECLEVSEAVLAKIAGKQNPQMLLGVFRQRWAELPAEQHMTEGDVWLAVEQGRDPGNLGTIIRTVEAVGAKGVILVGPSCDPFSREAVRASMGSVFAVPLLRMTTEAFLARLATWPGDVVGAHLCAAKDFRFVAYRGPVMLVMGSEGPGLSEALVRACTELVRIPMAGTLDSLNLAVAAALLLYQLRGPALRL
ncbi:MAG TPA: RNA methyltransferase [Hyphomicrobiaceae bacterium]|nr:RNA methyltransferase [Hyphomicrobiaceae bacterium]